MMVTTGISAADNGRIDAAVVRRIRRDDDDPAPISGDA
jgi:hypothetical protein